MRAEASTGLETPFARAARRSTGNVSLRLLLFRSGLEMNQRDGRNYDGKAVEERENLYI
jgi:hypothetical protein